MIPVIVGAVALAAGAGVGFALGKNDKPEQVIVKKAEVSEDYVKWCAERAGKNIETNTQAAPPAQQRGSSSDEKFILSSKFRTNFNQIGNLFGNPSVSNEFISEALNQIEDKAKIDNNQTALNFVAAYREQLSNRRISSSQRQHGSASGMKFIPSGDFSADFEKIENMLASPNVSNEFISEALYAIEGEARRKSFQGTLILVGNYREKLGKRRR